MSDDTYFLQRPDGEPGFRAHPWIATDRPIELRQELEGVCRLAWLTREFHSRRFGFLRAAKDEGGSARSIDEALAQDPDATEALWRSIDIFSAAASDHLASAAHMVWAGAYLFSLPVVVCASVEHSVAACWSLNPGLDASERAQRAHLLRYNDVSRFIEEVPDEQIRTEAKRQRRAYRKLLTDRFGDEAVFDGNGRLAGLGACSAPTFDEQFAETSQRLGLEKVMKRQYGILSQMAHPNPASVEFFYHREGHYRWRPADTKRLLWVGVFAYAQLVRHVTSYFSAPVEVQEEFDDAVLTVFPDFYRLDG